MGYAFISYSSKKEIDALAMRSLLENRGIRTWMAPRDIPAGIKYAGVITRAIKGSECLILLLTDEAQNSTWVDKEVEMALSNGKTVIPVALGKVTLNDNFQLYLGNQQIVPVKQISDDDEEFLRIVDQVIKLTGTDLLGEAGFGAGIYDEDNGNCETENDYGKEAPTPVPAKKRIRPWAGIIIAAIVLFVVLKACGIDSNNTNSNNTKGNSASNPEPTEEAQRSDIDDDKNGNDTSAQSVPTVINGEVNVPGLEESSLAVEGIESKLFSAEKAEIITYSGNISDEGQEDEYSFKAANYGSYRIDITGLQSDTAVALYVTDEYGDTLKSDTYCKNGEGITLNDLTAEHTYTILVKQASGLSQYSLAIGMQKPAINVSGYTCIADSLEYRAQRNIYLFTAPVDGLYRCELSEMQSGTQVELCMLNRLGEVIGSDSYCSNNEGITVKSLKAGEEYQVEVRQLNGFSSYTINLGYQKETVDISDLSSLTDSIQYTNQRNVYLFKVPLDGSYRFELSGMENGTAVELYLLNNLGESRAYDAYCRNGEGITVPNLKSGDVYELHVCQREGLSNYGVLIGKQKETIEVARGCTINDSIEYTDQSNVYSFTADTDGSLSVSISGMISDMHTELCVYNDLEETIASDYYCGNGDAVSVTDVPAGTHFKIEVKQREGFGAYSLQIE